MTVPGGLAQATPLGVDLGVPGCRKEREAKVKRGACIRKELTGTHAKVQTQLPACGFPW